MEESINMMSPIVSPMSAHHTIAVMSHVLLIC